MEVNNIHTNIFKKVLYIFIILFSCFLCINILFLLFPSLRSFLIKFIDKPVQYNREFYYNIDSLDLSFINIEDNTEILFGKDSEYNLYLIKGFSPPESGQVWTDQEQAEIRIPIRTTYSDLRLTIRGHRLTPLQTVEFTVNDRVYGNLGDGDNGFIINNSELVKQKYLDIKIVTTKPYSQEELGINDDPRALGFALQAIGLYEIPAINIEKNTEILFDKDSEYNLYLIKGFSPPESDRVWTVQEQAEIRIPIRTAYSDLKLTIRGHRLTPLQTVKFTVNDRVYGNLGDGANGFIISNSELVKQNCLDIKIVTSKLYTQKELGINDDPRALGFALQAIGLYEIPAINIKDNTEILFVKDSKYNLYLIKGFSPPESDRVWTAQEQAEIRIPIRTTYSDLKLTIRGHRLTPLQTVEFTVNDRVYGNLEDGDNGFIISNSELVKQNCLDIKIVTSKPYTPKELGINDDPRALGFALQAISLYEIPAINIEKNTEILFDKDSEYNLYLIKGFSSPESGHVWTDQEQAEIRIPIRTTYSDLRLTISGQKLTPLQTVKLTVNDRVYGNLEDGDNGFIISNSELVKQNYLDIKIVTSKLYAPKKLGMGEDYRTLGFSLQTIGLYKNN